MTRDLDASASVASCDVTADVGGNTRPGVVAKDVASSEGSAWMSTDDGVMVLVEDVGAESWGNIDATVMEDEIVLNGEAVVSTKESLTPGGVMLEGIFELLEKFRVVNGECGDGGNVCGGCRSFG